MEKLKIKKVNSEKEFEDTVSIRRIVFIKGQNVPEQLELDGLDSKADHFVVYLDGKAVGCGRIRFFKRYAKLERIAVLEEHRGKGFGRKITKFMINYCHKKNYNKLVLHSQIIVLDFYKKLGFKEVGNNFFEAGIEHIKMVMKY